MGEKVRAKLKWLGGLRFVAQADSGHALVLDSKSKPDHAGPSPMEIFLMGVAGCTAMDVAAILERMRQPLSQLEVHVEGERAETNPKRYTSVEIVYTVTGRGLDRDKVERAVALSHSTYCSASASLHPDIAITHKIELLEG